MNTISVNTMSAKTYEKLKTWKSLTTLMKGGLHKFLPKYISKFPMDEFTITLRKIKSFANPVTPMQRELRPFKLTSPNK